MIILLSPAKKLDFSKGDFTNYTKPQLWSFGIKLIQKLKTLNQFEIKKLMKLSDRLSELNYKRYQNFQLEHNLENSKQAIFAFKGDTYMGMDVPKLAEDDILWLQENLIILSGLYGTLHPLDLIQPYRLEMGTNLTNNSGKNLYIFWSEKITNYLNSKLKPQDFILNLASKEYSSVIDFKKIHSRVINVDFKETRKDNSLKIISIYAKRARGLMTKFCAENRCQTTQDIMKFDLEGYVFRVDLSSSTNLVFVR